MVPPETVAVDPEKPLYQACRKMLRSRARRIPLISADSQTGRPYVVSVVTQYRILKFIAVNVDLTGKLRKPLSEIRLGTYENLSTATMDTPVIDVINVMVNRSISSIPIVTSESECSGSSMSSKLTEQDVVVNVFEAVDVIPLVRGGNYADLELSVGEALLKRNPVSAPLYLLQNLIFQ